MSDELASKSTEPPSTLELPPPVVFNAPENFLNRELSLLQFNRRVLEQAKDVSVPLLERLRYLCISDANLDEFFEVRVASLKEKIEAGSVQTGPDNRAPADTLKAINASAHELVDEQYRVFNDLLLPELQEYKIQFIRREDWSNKQRKYLYSYFQNEVLPLLSPLGLDPAHPFPRILNKSLNFIVSLKGKDAFGRSGGKAVIQAPRALPRLLQIPMEETDSGPYDFVFLSSVIHEFVNDLFTGMEVSGCYQFRVTRNSDLFVDEEEVDDLLRALEGELVSRRYGDEVRLETADNCPQQLVNYLLVQFELTDVDMYQVNGPVNLSRAGEIYDLIDKPELKFPSFTPLLPDSLNIGENYFSVIRKKDVILHHPFVSFTPVIEFIRQASNDPSVIAIKQTLYRTGSRSAVVETLINAAKKGKEVTAVVELRARFDEEANISLASKLQEAGVHVVYGVVGYKTHAKMCLIIRRENKKLRYYAHLGTGNYHHRTARIYTDYGLLTADKEITSDVHKVFNQLTSLGRVLKLDQLLQSPFTLHDQVIKEIETETEHANAGKRARIIFKVNALVEPKIILALYAASQAGVKVDLIVRGICSLRPGVRGVSENITVRSVIGRFLEHTRVYYFGNNRHPRIYLSSADCMDRNFFRRVEVAFPLIEKGIRKQVLSDLHFYLRDNTQAWILQPDGTYIRYSREEDEKIFSAQHQLLEDLAVTT